MVLNSAIHMKHITSFVAFFFLMMVFRTVTASPYAESTNELTLLDRSGVEFPIVELSNREWAWLRNKRTLILGVARPDFAPVEIISNDISYEGFTADVIGMIGKTLHVDIKVIQFVDRETALKALATGEIDLVSVANNFELANHRVRLTDVYIPDRAVLYVRRSEERVIPPGLAGMRVAVANDYLPMRQLRELYPNAFFVPYSSREHALAAMSFGNADVYLGDAVSSNYLVNINYFNYVRLYRALDFSTNGFAFAVRSDDVSLVNAVNTALKLINDRYLADTLKRWSGGGASVVTAKIKLSASEQRWIDSNPVVRFVATNDSAPMSYFDSEGHFAGVSADILRAISLRTGIIFKVVRADESADTLTFIDDGKADLTILVPTLEREIKYHFSRALLSSTFALITRNEEGQPSSLSELRNKKIALPPGHSLRETLAPASVYSVVDVPNFLEAMGAVVEGKADAAVTFLPIAQYYARNMHEGRLKVSGILENSRVTSSFALRKSDTELASILDKALQQIPPDEIDVYQNRWRPKADVSSISWTDYRGLIAKISWLGFSLISLLLIWNTYIRSQYKLRQQAERALNEQCNFMRSLIDDTPHPIYVRDRKGRMIACNSNYLQVFDTTEEAVIGRTALEGPKVDRAEALKFHDDYMRVMDTGESLAMDRVLHLQNRESVIYHWIHPYYDSQGTVKGVMCGWIDISERRRLMEELQAALSRADQSSRAKTTFLATMSHEIRTPMSAVIGMLELALKNADHGRFDRQAIEVAYDSARGLLELIGDILDVVRIESGHVTLSPKRANLRELVESVARVFDGLARQKALTLLLNIDAVVNCDVLIDPMRFKQILSNLIGNAIKFTDTGEVKVSIDGTVMQDDLLNIQLTVEDTGIGISPEELAKLFQYFAQGNHGRTSRGGTGLGLAISKSLCELMGGEVHVRSVLGKGTCVEMCIPFNILPEISREQRSQEITLETEHPKLRVLVIDDQQANRVLLVQQLAFFEQDVTSGENGADGVRLWQEGNFDLVITDCNMPVMNGYEMTRKIREIEALERRPPCVIIGFTANAQPEERSKCLQAGMTEYLVKPISLAALSGLLLSLCETSPPLKLEGYTADEVETIQENLHALTGGDKAMMRTLLLEAHNSYKRDLVELKLQLENFIPDEFADLIHRIKGAARIMRAQRLITACELTEHQCCTLPLDLEGLTESARLVESELQALILQMRNLNLVEATD